MVIPQTNIAGGRMKKNLTKQFTDKLIYKILSGEYKKGDKLPPLRDLADLYGVSRSVVNASIAELESLGYVTVKPRKGVIINDWKREGTLGVLEGVGKFGFDKEILLSLLDTRFLVVCECAKLAAERATEEQIRELYLLIKKGRELNTVAKRTEYDRAFHHKIAVMSGNVINSLIIKSFERYSGKLLELFYGEDNVFGFVTDRHYAIYRAILARQPERARQEMAALLKHGEQIILKLSFGGDYGSLSKRG